MAFLLDGLRTLPIRDVSEFQKGFQFPGAQFPLPFGIAHPYPLRMFNSWKYSKGSYLVIIFAASFGTLILGIAFYLKNFSAILTGVIGGLTIVLGMLTAEWLRSSRQQIEETRTSYKNLVVNLERLLYSYDEFATDQYSRIITSIGTSMSDVLTRYSGLEAQRAGHNLMLKKSELSRKT